MGEEGPSRGHVVRGLDLNGRSVARIGQGVGSGRTTTSRHPSWGAGESSEMRAEDPPPTRTGGFAAEAAWGARGEEAPSERLCGGAACGR